MKRSIAHLAAIVLACFAGTAVSAEIALNVGAFDISGESKSAEAGIELRVSPFANGIIPVLGFMGNGDGASYGYLGLRYDIPLGGSGWIFTPGWGVGAWSQGDSKDLGHETEFRTILELAYRFAGGSRLGLAIYHLSNANLSETNPGEQSLILTWAIPLGGH